MTHRHPYRRTRTLKRSGLVACLLIVIAFAISTRRAVHWTSSNLERQVGLWLGQVGCAWRPDDWRLEDDPYAGSPGWVVAQYSGRPKLDWWFTRSAIKPWAWVSLPLWIPFLLVAVPTALLWHRERRFTRESIEKWKLRLCPRQPKKLTIGLVALCCLIHGIAAIPCLIVFSEVVEFFFVPGGTLSFDGTISWSSGEQQAALLRSIVTWAAPCLLLGTPVWGFLWAWLYVRFMNLLLLRMRPHCCVNCGYDLTGNTSGVCPECGKAI